MEEEYDFIFKIVIIGDSSVGKTGILNRYLHNEFYKDTKATVGVEFGAKKLNVNKKQIRLQIWDTAGQERYRAITSTYYKGAKGAFIVFDISNKTSFENVDRWIKEIKMLAELDIFIILIGNKSDLEEEGKREVSIEEAKTKAEFLGIPYLETSAKTSSNIDKAFNDVCSKVVDKLIIQEKSKVDDLDYIFLNNSHKIDATNKEKEKKCC